MALVERNIVQKYKLRLKQLRQEEIARLDNLQENLRTSLQDATDELSFYDNHPGDVADTTFERGKDLGLKIMSENRLHMIEDAIKAIDEGKYGFCEKCGREISEDRLDTIPYTTMCTNCKRDNSESYYRPIEEQVIRLPFGKVVDNHFDNTDYIGFDGEDTWQGVARYGTSNGPSDVGGVDNYNETYIHPDENRGEIQDYEKIAVKKDKDGQFYQDFIGTDDESPPSTRNH